MNVEPDRLLRGHVIKADGRVDLGLGGEEQRGFPRGLRPWDEYHTLVGFLRGKRECC